MTEPKDTGGPGALTLNGLSLKFGSLTVLDDITASLGGRVIGLLGPNGAGKTSLIRTLLGFYKPQKGEVSVLGHPLRRGALAIRELVGYMPESDAHLASMTAVRFIRYMAQLSGLPSAIALERAHEALFYVGLGEARYRLVGTFSTGMKQMVKLAQAIVHGPRFLILDEPTNGLDPSTRRRMLDLVLDLRDRGETKILLSSHLLRDVEAVCDEVLILNKGRVAAVCDLESERQTNKSFVEVELVNPDGDFSDRLLSLGCEVAVVDQRRMKLVMPSGVTVRDLMTAASDNGVAFRRLDHKRDSLQEIFLRAMEADRGRV